MLLKIFWNFRNEIHGQKQPFPGVVQDRYTLKKLQNLQEYTSAGVPLKPFKDTFFTEHLWRVWSFSPFLHNLFFLLMTLLNTLKKDPFNKIIKRCFCWFTVEIFRYERWLMKQYVCVVFNFWGLFSEFLMFVNEEVSEIALIISGSTNY